MKLYKKIVGLVERENNRERRRGFVTEIADLNITFRFIRYFVTQIAHLKLVSRIFVNISIFDSFFN